MKLKQRCIHGHAMTGRMSNGRKYCKICSNNRSKVWSQNNKDKRRIAQQRRMADPKRRAAKSQANLNSRLIRTLNISLLEAQKILATQNGRCAICGKNIIFGSLEY